MRWMPFQHLSIYNSTGHSFIPTVVIDKVEHPFCAKKVNISRASLFVAIYQSKALLNHDH